MGRSQEIIRENDCTDKIVQEEFFEHVDLQKSVKIIECRREWPV
jgi:hypothetical protein